MALFEISEPSASPAARALRRAIGIDLGTTNSLVATVRGGGAVVLPDSAGRALVPSVVRYGEHAIEVGDDALSHAADDPHDTIASVKRLMGRGLGDATASQRRAYRFADGEGTVRIATRAGPKTPVEVSAEILKTLRIRAETSLGGAIDGAVVTVPAYFDDGQRQATKDAAALAGLPVLRLLNEPTAAAIAYGLDNAAEGTYAVFDLGGGTFDISILRLARGVFEVLATNGDSALGGDDFDQAIVDWIVESAKLPPLSAADARRLLARARQAKERLTHDAAAPIVVSFGDDARIESTLSAQTFDAITRGLVERTLAPVRRALRDARLAPSAIDGVVLVGGATRMRQVRRAVADFFGKAPLTDLDPDQVVALGAAIQANKLAGNRESGDWLLLDVIPLSLGLETIGGLVEKIVPRNSTIPVVRAQDFTTFKDGQTAMALHVLQGEREKVSDCRSLARFELRGIPPMTAGAARIRVSFAVDADGLLSVSAREQTTGIEASIEVKPSYGLTDAEIARMLEDSLAHATDDTAARALAETRVEAERIVTATQSALASDGALLGTRERDAIEAALTDVRARIDGDDCAALAAAVDALNAATAGFAAKRMDRSVARALAGRRVDAL
ncbi:MAG TPA: Fe-S protein assembly chaperone HscA [Casimicrobiaceae bacterium]|nr:Fe-S protein assembly chaperone HscA [Casimicrobiaceae bacterium]